MKTFLASALMAATLSAATITVEPVGTQSDTSIRIEAPWIDVAPFPLNGWQELMVAKDSGTANVTDGTVGYRYTLDEAADVAIGLFVPQYWHTWTIYTDGILTADDPSVMVNNVELAPGEFLNVLESMGTIKPPDFRVATAAGATYVHAVLSDYLAFTLPMKSAVRVEEIIPVTESVAGFGSLALFGLVGLLWYRR